MEGAWKKVTCIGAAAQGVALMTQGIEVAEMLISAGIGRKAPYFHPSWILCSWDTPDDEATHRVRISYDLIRSKLPKKVQATLRPV